MGALGKNGHGDRKIIIFSISKGEGISKLGCGLLDLWGMNCIIQETDVAGNSMKIGALCCFIINIMSSKLKKTHQIFKDHVATEAPPKDEQQDEEEVSSLTENEEDELLEVNGHRYSPCCLMFP